jgi:ribonuclease HI
VIDDTADQAVEIYTDGACSGNPGPGGWGAVLRYGAHVRELRGGEGPSTTNNRMEMMAAIQALESLTRPSTVRIHTDSTYLRNGVTSWVAGWQRNGWLTKARTPVKNADLWQRLTAAVEPHQVEWLWVKGHAGDPGNERADTLAGIGLTEARNGLATTPGR